MSIILKGIDLPKEKDEALLLLILGDGTVAEKISSDRYEEMANTEAIQIPTPHGRLIDGGRLNHIFTIAESRENVFGEHTKPTTEEFRSAVYFAPTILEAEG